MLILSNTKVNSFLFINLELITLLICYYNMRSKPLSYILLVTSYNKKGKLSISYYI